VNQSEKLLVKVTIFIHVALIIVFIISAASALPMYW
jgi:hypothetical protein